jgi:hypothetical protein
MAVFSFVARTSGTASLELVTKLDQQIIQQRWLESLPETFKIELPDSDEHTDHVLGIQLIGKSQQDTKIDDQGHIVQDTVIIIENFNLDGVELQNYLPDISQYWHDGNGSKNWAAEAFYGTMGCNGEVKIQFHTPSYLWLLEIL